MVNASPPPPYSDQPPLSSASDFAPIKSALRSRHPKTPEALARERLVRPHLPPVVRPKNRPIREFLFSRFYKGLLLLIHLVYSVYLKIRWTYHTLVNRGFAILYYHHRTPQLIAKDVKELKEKGKLPGHVSVVVEYERGGLDNLLEEVAEIACWCASAGIPKLSVYERTGILKSYISTAHRAMTQRLHAYFGKSRPRLRVHAPHSPAFVNGGLDEAGDAQVDLEVVFISEEDGRESLVDLAKTLCDMAQRGKISCDDVSIELIDAEVKENVMDEPDLLILFSPNVSLKGYPPWQVRLTEIFHVQDNESVGYQVFLRALHKFAKTEMRFGR
ncbi:hypothetical protein RUND412_009994 [Rhizina undulata]